MLSHVLEAGPPTMLVEGVQLVGIIRDDIGTGFAPAEQAQVLLLYRQLHTLSVGTLLTGHT